MWPGDDSKIVVKAARRRVHRLSAYVWGIGVIAWLSAGVVVVVMLWASNITSAAEKRAELEEETEAHPMIDAATSIYRVGVAFGGTTAWPVPVPEDVLEPFNLEVGLAMEAIAALDGVGGIAAESDSVGTAIADWERALDEMLLSLDASDSSSRAAHATASRDALSSVASTLQVAGEISRSESVEDSDRADTYRDRVQLLAIAVAVLTLGGGGVVMISFARNLAKSLAALGAGARRVADGDHSYAAPLTGPAEVVEVASAFNMMAVALHEREESLVHRAYHDLLTGLGNRAELMLRLDAAVARLGRTQGNSVALMLLDLDRFKELNDALGHSAGDDALKIVAERISACVRTTDTVCRLGGDEFIVIAEGSAAATVGLAGRILDAISRPLETAGQTAHLSASAGISLAVTGAEETEDLLRDADLAMYAAKARGGNLVEMFDSTLLDEARRRHRIASELRDAIDTSQIEVHYQPVMDVDSQVLVGAEALVRWRHPELGLLAPAEFLDIAEQGGLIVPLGAQVLDLALNETEAWRREFTGTDQFKISVNVSARQLVLPNFVATVEGLLERSGVAASNLWIEITETALLCQSDEINDGLNRLREQGVRIALDDFGTGYSSLHLINTLNVDIVKIDRSFVTGISQHGDRYALVAAVIEMATAFGLDTVAEGVETEDDLAAISELGASAAQGYWFGKPIPAAEFQRRWLTGRQIVPTETTRRSVHVQ